MPEEHDNYIPDNAKAAKLIEGDPSFPIHPGQVGLAWAWDDPDDPPNHYTFYFEHSDGQKYLYLALGEELEWVEE